MACLSRCPTTSYQFSTLEGKIPLVFVDGLKLMLLSCSVFGRIIPGYLGDRFGRFNVTIATTVFSTIIVLALWIPGTSNAAIFVFSILYGFASGAFVAMVAALVAQVSDIRQIGVRNGTNFFVISWAALTGNPIAGALISHNNGGYIGLQIFCGIVILVGALFFIASRHVQVGPGLKKC